MVLSWQTDLTRVITFQMGHEMSGRAYPEVGFGDGHHSVTHHQGDPDKIAKVVQINIFHAKMLAYYLDKLRSTPDGDGSLLDHSLVFYGAGMGSGNQHAPDHLPLVAAGGGIAGNRHLRPASQTSIANLWLGVAHKFGSPIETFGESNGEFEI